MSDQKPIYRSIRPNEDHHTEIEYRSIAVNNTAPPPLINQATISHNNKALFPHESISTLTAKSNTMKSPAPVQNYSLLKPRSIPPPPFHLEPHTTVAVKGSIARIGTVIGNAFSNQMYDFSINMEKSKWKVQAYSSNKAQKCDLILKMYKDDGELILEFQRRSGCVVLFMNVFHDIINICSRNQILSPSEKYPQKLQSTQKREFPEALLKHNDVKPENIIKAIAPVYLMMASNMTDSQLLGIKAILALCSNFQIRKALIITIPFLLKRVEDEILCGEATLALSHFANDIESHGRIIVGVVSIIKIASGSRVTTNTIQMAAIHILIELCHSYCQEIRQSNGMDQLFALLENFQHISNSRLRSSLSQLRSILLN